MKLKKMPISSRLVVQYTSVVMVVLLIFSGLTLFLVGRFARMSDENELLVNAAAIKQYLEYVKSVDRESLSEIEIKRNISFDIYDGPSRNGRLIYSTDGDTTAGADDNESYISSTARMYIGGKTYLLVLKTDFDDIFDKIDALPELLLIIIALGIVVCIGSGIYLMNRFLKPIKDITKTANEINTGTLGMRIRVDGPEDDFTKLADTFNVMIGRLEEDFSRQKRFVADASHELRTPLAVMHGNIRMLERWGSGDPTVLSQSLHVLRCETENMINLVKRLLYLAQGDAESTTERLSDFDVNALICEVADEFQITNCDISFNILCDAELRIEAQYETIKQVLRILVDNAIKFSAPPASIDIKAETVENGVSIAVVDNGVGISAEHIPHIFDRFYRADQSRTRSAGGYGLGLSIAKQIIDSHRGTISAESEPGEGTKMTIFLPGLI